MKPNTTRQTGRGRAKPRASPQSDEDSAQGSAKRSLAADLEEAASDAQGPPPAKRPAADGLSLAGADAMDTDPDVVLQPAAYAAAAGSGGATPVGGLPIATQADPGQRPEGPDVPPAQTEEDSPAPELVAASGHAHAPDGGKEEDELGEKSPAAQDQAEEADNFDWAGVMELKPGSVSMFARIPRGVRVALQAGRAALRFHAADGSRPRASIPLKVYSPPRASSPISPGTRDYYNEHKLPGDDDEEQHLQPLKDWYSHLTGMEFGLTPWADLSREQRAHLLDSATFRRIPDKLLPRKLIPKNLVHLFTTANGLHEPELESKVLSKYTSREDDHVQTLTYQQHGIPNAQGALFRHGFLNVEHAPVLKGHLEGKNVDAQCITLALYRAAFSLDYALPECWGPKSHGRGYVSVQLVPAREYWQMSLVLVTVDGPHKAHIVATLLTLSAANAIEVDEPNTGEKLILNLQLAGIPLPFEQLQTMRDTSAWKVKGVLGLKQAEARDATVQAVMQHLSALNLKHTAIEYHPEYMGSRKTKDSRTHANFTIYVLTGANLMPKDNETILVDTVLGQVGIQFVKQADGRSEYAQSATCRLDVYPVRGHFNFHDGLLACQRAVQTQEGREYFANAILEATGVKPVLTAGPDGFYLSMKAAEDGKKYWSINLEEGSMAALATEMQKFLAENTNGRVQARLRVVGVQNVFGLSQVFDVVLNKQTIEYWLRKRQSGGPHTVTAAARGTRGGQTAVSDGGLPAASVQSMLEAMMESKFRGFEGKVRDTLTPLTDLTATVANKVTAMKQDMSTHSEQLMSKTMEVKEAVKDVKAGVDKVQADTDKLKNFDVLTNAFTTATQALQMFTAPQGQAQLPPPAPARGAAPPPPPHSVRPCPRTP